MATARRVLFEHDGRHPNIYLYEPPMTVEQFQFCVDEIVGTSVDTLMFFLGDGRTFLHDTQVGELWGHNVERWNHLVFYRAHENARRLIESGHDQLRIVCERAHEKGLDFFPSLLVQQPSEDRDTTSGRCSDFRFDNRHLEIGAVDGLPEGSPATRMLDFAHEAVRDERFAILDEVMTHYPIDGLELHLAYGYPYFKPSETEAHLETMTAWIHRIRDRMREVSAQQHRPMELAVQVPASIEGCRSIGLDLPRWIDAGLVDLVVPVSLDRSSERLQADVPVAPFVEAAQGTPCRVYGYIGSALDNDRLAHGTLAHMRAAACAQYRQGVDGIYLAGYYGRFPYHPEDYEILREMAHPDIMAWKDKHYVVPTELQRWPDRAGHFGYVRPLPAPLSEGGPPAVIPLPIADDLARADGHGRLHRVGLRVRITGITPDDHYRVCLNGAELPDALCRRLDFTYRMNAARFRVGRYYWFDYTLDRAHLPVPGENTVEITLLHRDPRVSVPVQVRDVELEIEYTEGRNRPRRDEMLRN